MEIGIIIIAFLDGLINMANTIAAVSSAEELYQTNTTSKMYKGTILLTGLFSVIGAVLGLILYGPYTSFIVFLESTKILNRVALIIGGALFTLLGFVPALGAIFS